MMFAIIYVTRTNQTFYQILETNITFVFRKIRAAIFHFSKFSAKLFASIVEQTIIFFFYSNESFNPFYSKFPFLYPWIHQKISGITDI